MPQQAAKLKSALPSVRMLPDMIHVGFAKAASTYLQSFFRQHPQLHLVFKANFFAPFASCEYPEGFAAYEDLFRPAGKDQVRIESDEHLILPMIHPTLGVRAITRDSSDEVLHRLVQCVPSSKVLLVLRNQTDMLLSTYSQYLLGGGTLSCNAFIRELLQCQNDGNDYFCAYFAEIIQKFEAAYDSRLLVLLLEDFGSNNQAILDRVCSFLDVTPLLFRGSFKAHRKGLSAFGFRVLRRLNQSLTITHDGRYEPRQKISFDSYHRLCNFIRVVDHYCMPLGRSRRSALDAETLNQIERTFSDDNQHLSVRMRRNLVSLGYRV